jgi:hypothetical protein
MKLVRRRFPLLVVAYSELRKIILQLTFIYEVKIKMLLAIQDNDLIKYGATVPLNTCTDEEIVGVRKEGSASFLLDINLT